MLFSRKNKKNISKCLKFLLSVLSVKISNAIVNLCVFIIICMSKQKTDFV